MVKIDENFKCVECGSVWSKIKLDDRFHKVRYRICHEGCSRDGEIIKDLGLSIKHKLKHQRLNNG